MKLPLPLAFYVFPVVCVLAGVASQYSGLDTGLERLFYDSQNQQWPYRDVWWTEKLLHRGGRDFVAVIVFGMILFALAAVFNSKLARYRRSAGFVLLSSLSGIGLVAILKASTHIYTPWDLAMFGGQYPHIRLFDAVADNLPVGHAFPAGHSSGGYALVSLYFIARYHHYRHSSLLLYFALGLGLIFGVTQQMRGAHMLSHDLFTLAICWASCLAWYPMLKPLAESGPPGTYDGARPGPVNDSAGR